MLQISSCFVYLLICFTLATGRSFKQINVTIAAPDHTVFRRDYNFYPSINGWLKFHSVPTNWDEARRICDLEGARLASPINENFYQEMRILQASTESKSIFTGIHTLSTGNAFFSEEGIHVDDMPVQWHQDDPNNKDGAEKCVAMVAVGLLADFRCDSLHPYVCYRQKQGTSTVNTCGNNDYTRDTRTGSCYKLHQTRANWNQAHTTCTAEGAHLAIINGDQEALVLKDLLVKAKLKNTFVNIGFYNWARYNANVYFRWSTMDGKSIEEAGFARWHKGEPNNLGGVEYCGSVFHKDNEPLSLNDGSCTGSYPFICEIDSDKVSE